MARLRGADAVRRGLWNVRGAAVRARRRGRAHRRPGRLDNRRFAGLDPDPAIRERIGPDLDPDSQYPLWAELQLGRGYTVRNCGVFGERTDQIAARLDRCAAGADALVVQGGINDIAQGRDVAGAAENLRTIVRRGRHRGQRVMVADVLPWNNGDRRAARRIVRLNTLIARMAREEDAELLRFNQALADPARPDRMRASLTADGDHPSVAGYRRLGRLLPRP